MADMIRFSKMLLAVLISGLLAIGSSGRAVAEPYRLGFSGKDLPGQGVMVLSVTPGGPASRLYRPGNPNQAITLTPGDVITAIDGKPVRSLAEYYQALNGVAPANVRITIRDSSNGQSIELATLPVGTGTVGLPKICLLLIADTNAAKIGESVRIDAANIMPLFLANIPKQQRRIIKLEGNQVSRDNILRTIRGLGANGLVAGRDTLVIYYSGHGAYNLQASDHMMTTSNGIVYFRGDIEKAASKVRPRATVILSDACSVLVIGQPGARAPSIQEPEKVSPIFDSLFLKLPPGMTAISAAMKGQTAGCSTTMGGYFTTTLCSTIVQHTDERLTWSDVLREVNAVIKDAYPTNQVAYIVTDAASGDPPPRLGVVAQGTARGRAWHGVEVTRVMNGYPGQSLRRPGESAAFALVPGRDIIQRINGQSVSDYAEFVNAVRNSPPEMTITVYNATSGQVEEFEVKLRD
jgi:S1-C subfamily serine protease